MRGSADVSVPFVTSQAADVQNFVFEHKQMKQRVNLFLICSTRNTHYCSELLVTGILNEIGAFSAEILNSGLKLLFFPHSRLINK